MINRKTAQILLLIALVLVLLSLMFPAVSGCVELEREKGIFVFRGLNFAEVSLFGVFAVLLSAVAIVTALAKIRFKLKCIAIPILSFLGYGSYIAGYLSVRQVIFDAGAVHVHDEYGFYVSIFVYAFACSFALYLALKNNKKLGDFYYDNI